VERLNQIDLFLFHQINSTFATEWLDPWFKFITHAHQVPWVRYVLLPILLGWWLYSRRDAALRGIISMVIVVSAVDLLSHRVLKPFVARPRPFLVESNNAIMRLDSPSG